jgi:hypothetical protein
MITVLTLKFSPPNQRRRKVTGPQFHHNNVSLVDSRLWEPLHHCLNEQRKYPREDTQQRVMALFRAISFTIFFCLSFFMWFTILCLFSCHELALLPSVFFHMLFPLLHLVFIYSGPTFIRPCWLVMAIAQAFFFILNILLCCISYKIALIYHQHSIKDN